MLDRAIARRLLVAVRDVLPGVDAELIRVRPASDSRFGDYQANALMGLARERGMPPRELATAVVAKLDVADLCSRVEVAGPGFLNFFIRPEALARELDSLRGSGSPAGRLEEAARTIVLDFSSPNVAKPMHVGHVRSTVLGDCLARVLRCLGHRVITDNHIGDWGTQFGMLLVGWKRLRDPDALERDPLTELERLYRLVNQECRESPATLEAARAELVKLQAGDRENHAIWEQMLQLSRDQFETIYRRMGVRFDQVLGESFYNPWLAGVVAELLARGVARESEGAVAVFSEGGAVPGEDPFLIQRDGEWRDNPMLVRKSDGGYNYATTDLATLDYRVRTWHPDEIIYVTDGRQQLHFRQVFEAFRRWQPEVAAGVRLAHVWFGSILGGDGKPFKTRSGDTVRLSELLDEAEERAFAIVSGKRPELPEAERREIARVVGIGAVKYQDLLPNRQSDYVFSWDKMLALQGNTAPYIQYQYTRAAKVVRDAALEGPEEACEGRFCMDGAVPVELQLGLQLAQFRHHLELVVQDHRPNLLCSYLYELAARYARFYEGCPVLRAESVVRARRVALCDLTSRVLRQGLDCLGIEVSEAM